MNFEAFFKLSYGLYIISAKKGDKKNGYVGNTVFQVTAEPPQVAVSCNKDNFSSEFIAESGAFSISVLKQNASSDIIGLFGYQSGKDVDKFEKVDHIIGESGSPIVLEDCVAWFDCKLVTQFDVGSHIIFVGEILANDLTDSESLPLTYAHYRDVKKGLAPKNAPTYVDKSKISKPIVTEKPKKVDEEQKYQCDVCGYVYDPAEGDPALGIPKGTAFEDLPDDWTCPICGAAKSDFSPI